ncbi:MAG TPA: hypothetical protein DDZ88_17970 [Verrucomicrobiales bacterium]|nr:hypothetical protein [Verrucomicrobiales bacterium]
MIRLRPFLIAGVFLAAVWCATAQTAAPPPPALTQEQKEAAAAIEAPKTFTPPPLPGQLQPAKPAPPAPAITPPPVTPPAVVSPGKMQEPETATPQPVGQEAPRVSAPSDKLPITSSTSTSRQFIVHGKVFETRSAMSSRCEEISKELRKVLNDRESWVLPVVVLLNTGEEAAKSKGPPVSTAITEMTHGGFHLQVTVNERPGLNAADLRKEVVRVLLAERILRNRQQIATPEGRLLLPDWVMTGVLHAMDYKASARPSALFATIFRSGKIYGIEEIIAASPVEMDGLSRTIYETSCCALVLALVDQPDGARRFNKFLNALASDPRSERELLDAAFPSFAASASSLNKWWSLQLAALSKPGIAEPYTPAESLKAIEDAITIRYAAKANEVPQNVKPRPFVLPLPLIVASSLPKPAPPPAASPEPAPKPKSKESTGNPADAPPASVEAAEATDDAPKRSLWRRLLFLGDPAKEDKEESQTQDKPADTAAIETTGEMEAADKPGFIGRLFGFGADEKKPDEKSKAAVIEKPQTAEKEAPVPVEEKKPSKLNPLNWFRGDNKKPDETKTEEPPAKSDQAEVLPAAPLDMARLLSPSLVDAWHWLAPAAPRQTAEPILNFLRRKPKAEEAPEAVKTDEAPKKSEPKKAAKPRAKPAAPTSTTKPEKPAAATATPAKSGLVPVSLPLEGYEHILKREDRVAILNHNIATLRALELRVSPLFRPVVTGYLAAVTDLQQGKTKDMDKRLAALHEFALIAYQKSIAVRDYLDWFEASAGSGLSGKFEDFLNLPKLIEKELPPRTDPISKYLDAIDQEFSK